MKREPTETQTEMRGVCLTGFEPNNNNKTSSLLGESRQVNELLETEDLKTRVARKNQDIQAEQTCSALKVSGVDSLNFITGSTISSC